MITQTDAETIIFKAVKSEFPDVCIERCGNITNGKITKPKIVIIGKPIEIGKYFEKCFIEVNYLYPDINEKVDIRTLNEIERQMLALFKNMKSSIFDNTCYRYSRQSNGKYKDSEIKCHYVNVKVLFEIINV